MKGFGDSLGSKGLGGPRSSPPVVFTQVRRTLRPDLISLPPKMVPKPMQHGQTACQPMSRRARKATIY